LSIHRSGTIFCRPVRNPNVTIRNFCIAVRTEFKSEEERQAFQAMQRSVNLQCTKERVLGQLGGLKARDQQKGRVRKVAKPTWQEPFGDEPWYHGVQ
jgi:hypothetical protein